MKKIILGYGKTGKSFEKYLKKNSEKYLIYDHLEKKSQLKKNELNKFDTFYVSPGIRLEDLFSKTDLQKKIFLTDLDIFFKKNSSYKIGITGTNGKSTFAYYLFQYLSLSTKVSLVGNIGRPMLECIDSTARFTIIELSSFQLHKMNKNFLDLSVITNIQVDHLDYHGNQKNYVDAKLRICNDGKKTFFLDQSKDLKMQAKRVAKYVLPDKNLDSIKLMPLQHRLEKVNKNILNDSKSTNSHSLLYALKKTKFKGHLIICGSPHKENLSQIKIVGPKRVWIFGKHRFELKNIVEHSDLHIEENLLLVLKKIFKIDLNSKILFSPGNPSGKDFNNFEERGNYFKKIVMEVFNEQKRKSI